jgi:hypothetical protein
MLAAVAAMVSQIQNNSIRERLERALRGEEAGAADELRQEVVSGLEAAKVLGCTVRTVQILAKRGSIQRIVLPGRLRGCGYSRKSVEALVTAGV